MSHLAAADPSHDSGAALAARLRAAIEAADGALRFDDYMRLALYAPGLGYYANTSRKFGRFADDGSDFVTAPELSPLFGRALARQVAQICAVSAPCVTEFGAGSGALAADVLDALGDACERYRIVELSGVLRERQRATIAARAPAHLAKVTWLDALPDGAHAFDGCVLGNEVLDAMPIRIARKTRHGWDECAVAWRAGGYAWTGRPLDAATIARVESTVPDARALPADYRVELHDEAAGFVATIVERLACGAALFIDYGFPAHEYYHPQRAQGTLMCHARHRAHDDPFAAPGREDITAHVDFSGIARAAIETGATLAGYTTQARFLMNCGLLGDLTQLGAPGTAAYARATSGALKLLSEAEMGELFKAIAFVRGIDVPLLGFAQGDRSGTL